MISGTFGRITRRINIRKMKHYINDIEASTRNLKRISETILDDLQRNVYTKYTGIDAKGNEYIGYIEFIEDGDAFVYIVADEMYNGKSLSIQTPFTERDRNEIEMNVRMLHFLDNLENNIIKIDENILKKVPQKFA